MICSVTTCENKATSKGFCNPHYQSWLKYGDPLKARRKQELARGGCKVPGCTKPHKSRGYCDKHYFQLRVHGDAERYTIHQRNTYRVNGSVVMMDLRDRHGNIVAITKFNNRHLRRVLEYKWRVTEKQGHVYVGGTRNSTWVEMHRFIAQPPKGVEVDHIDRDPLNNLDNNLRQCARHDNMRNARFKVGKSGYIGVQVDVRKKANPYCARINVFDQPIIIGGFADPAEAAYVRDQLAMQLHGEFAILNFEY